MRWTLLAFSVLLAAPAYQDDCDEKECKVKLVLSRDHDYYSSDIDSIEKAGIKVVETRVKKKKKPSIWDIQSALDSGIDVRVEGDDYASWDLKSLGGRKGTATVVLRTDDHYASDLKAMVKKGVCLEIRTDEYSVYDLKRIVGK